MSRCATCDHPSVAEINRQLRAGVPQSSVAAWTADHPPRLSRLAIGRHERRHLGQSSAPGRRPPSGDVLRDIVARASDRMAAGEIEPGIRDAIDAQKEINRQGERGEDRDLIIRIGMILSGQIPGPSSTQEWPADREVDLDALLQPGDVDPRVGLLVAGRTDDGNLVYAESES